MKKFFITLLIVLVVFVAPLMMFISNYKQKQGEITKFNIQFEECKEGKINGIDVASLINASVDNNERYEIEKNEEGIYIDDDFYCVRIEVMMKSVSDNTQIITYAMEDIYSLGIDRFVKNFNLLEFECQDISYNSVGRVSKIIFKFAE